MNLINTADDLPLIVQSDLSLVLEVRNKNFEKVRDEIIKFADLVKSPDYLHTYKINLFSLWNAVANGIVPDNIIDTLRKYSKYPVPRSVIMQIKELGSRYGKAVLKKHDEETLLLTIYEKKLFSRLKKVKKFNKHVYAISDNSFIIKKEGRGIIKSIVMGYGYPIIDNAGYDEGEHLDINLKETLNDGRPFTLRSYQKESITRFWMDGSEFGGSGVIVLPCGAGKTIVGIGIMAKAKSTTLILCPHTTAIRQWINELLDKTDLTEYQIGEYSGNRKEIKPVTIATYQIFNKNKMMSYEELFNARKWGLIIYDEVHLLPAPVFRLTANIQAIRRVGMTATLVREDRKESEIFVLIGPKKFEMGWKKLEADGWIAPAICTEIRAGFFRKDLKKYSNANARNKYRIASENPAKMHVVKKILEQHRGEQAIIIGQYLSQLREYATMFKAPIICGSTSAQIRNEYYQKFRNGEIKLLVVSKVANFALDLPETTVAIQISGMFGSRQEEAQRLGRILRPKNGRYAYFYSVISRNSEEVRFASKRQFFLIEQGYRYNIIEWKDVDHDE